jgi:hypothetical protein
MLSSVRRGVQEVAMTLEQYRLKNKLSYAKLAKKLGAKHATIARRWCLPLGHPNRMIPSPVYMRRIIEATLGAVRADSWYIGVR